MPLEVEVARAVLRVVDGPLYGSACHLVGVWHQVGHLCERYNSLRGAVDINRKQLVMIVAGRPVRKKESLGVEFVTGFEMLKPLLRTQVSHDLLERNQYEARVKPVNPRLRTRLPVRPRAIAPLL